MWSDKNDLPLNFDKIKTMLFYVDGSIKIFVKGRAVKQVSLYKLLGILIDSNLTFRPHAIQAVAKAQGACLKVSCIFIGRKGLPIKIGLQVYVALCRSLAEYAAAAW